MGNFRLINAYIPAHAHTTPNAINLPDPGRPVSNARGLKPGIMRIFVVGGVAI